VTHQMLTRGRDALIARFAVALQTTSTAASREVDEAAA
jgi:hypothetical protein